MTLFRSPAWVFSRMMLLVFPMVAFGDVFADDEYLDHLAQYGPFPWDAVGTVLDDWRQGIDEARIEPLAVDDASTSLRARGRE